MQSKNKKALAQTIIASTLMMGIDNSFFSMGFGNDDQRPSVKHNDYVYCPVCGWGRKTESNETETGIPKACSAHCYKQLIEIQRGV